jgi:hypothetical protein
MLFIRLILVGIRSLILILLSTISVAKAELGQESLLNQIFCDYEHYYHPKGIFQRTLGLGVGGLMANSAIDPNFRNDWQHNIRGNFTDKVSIVANDYSKVATYPIAVPIYLISLWVSAQYNQHNGPSTLELWANHSLRTLVVGSPEQLFLTHLLGGGRPQTGSPAWHFFEYHRAVSGHAFYGAIPLLNLAKLTTNPIIKNSAYALSTLPGLARINNDKHYLSQVWLGWWLAFNATQVVWRNDIVSKKPQLYTINLSPLDNGIFLGMESKF